MKVDTYFFNTGEKLCTFALSPIVVENHRVLGGDDPQNALKIDF